MPADLVRERLLDQRRALLDLGTRNRLINVPLRDKGVRTVEIVDERANEVYRLLTAGKGLTFLPGQPQAEEGTQEPAERDQEAGGIPQPADEEVDENNAVRRQADTKLQTRLSSEALQKRLFDIWYDARTLEEEQGVNILYLALGLLRWYEEEKSATTRHAPLVLLPVQLQRSSAAERFTLHWRGEPSSPNLSIQAKLRSDFGLVIEDFPDEDEVDVAAYMAQVATAVAGKARWEVLPDAMVLGFFSFAKFLMYRDLDPDNWPETNALHRHPVVAALLGDGFERLEPIIGDDEPIDPIIPPLALNHIVDADSSQAVAIEEAVRGRHLVIKGPPGTGKSQTIANIIAGAALQGKKILFVAEKMAALEVVQRRLRQAGLGPMTLELHSAKAKKRLVLEDLRRTRDMIPRLGTQDESLIARMSEVQTSLNHHAATLHRVLAPSGLSAFRLFGHLLRVRDGEGLPDVTLEGAASWTAQDVQDRLDLAAELAGRLGSVGDPASHVWRGVWRDALDPNELDQLAVLLASLKADLKTVGQAGAAIGADFDRMPVAMADVEALLRMARAALACPPDADREALASPIWRNDPNALAELVTLGRSRKESSEAMGRRFRPEAWNLNFKPIRSEIASSGTSWLRFFNGGYRGAMAQLRAALSGPVPRGFAERLSLVDQMIAAQVTRRLFETRRRLGAGAFGAQWNGENSDWDRLQALTDWWRKHRHATLGKTFLTQLAAHPRGADLGGPGSAMVEVGPRLLAHLTELQKFLHLDIKAAFGAADWTEVTFERLAVQLQLWLSNLESITRWIAFANRCRVGREAGLGSLIDALLDGSVGGPQLVPTVERAYYDALRSEFFERLPALKRFDGELQDRTVETFRALDRGRITLARETIAGQHLQARPVASGGIGPLGVLNGEFAKKRNHLPIRQLLDKAGPAIQQLKPVMMMSPLSVSQFLKPGALDFDLLVIDEASQIEPVDALGAVARARQMVVVGDERQLPPTRFFAKLTGDLEERDEEDTTFKASDAESVLDLCLAKGMTARMLNWHYRSKHHTLIAVSNREFYDNRLMVVPSPHQGGEELGLVFRYLPQATYDRGNTRTNALEAKAVAEAIIAHARYHPGQSLGVATFSVAQRQAILKELELLRRANPDTEPFFNRAGTEPFFVKNLENVQGDERDVIFISVGYGRSPGGHLSMGFGPLNLEGGERRLNVLISRAKHRCEVFSSITGEDIDLERASARGVVALKLFLDFAQNGRLGAPQETGREADSLFEEQVAAQLRMRGHVIAGQIGSAGFFVDLAVVDPERPGRFVLGIECDGAQYHSLRSARDRDRLREHVLEEHGWIIHRIWSTDWYLRPQEELAKVEAAIARAREEWRRRDDDLAAPSMMAPADPEDGFEDEGRFDQAAEAGAPSLSQPYVEAAPKISTRHDLQDLSPARIAALVSQVVEVEGPVHEQEIIVRLRDAFGLGRAGSRVREAVLGGIYAALATGKITGGPFHCLPGQAITIRDRSAVDSAGLRKPDMLPTEEIETAFRAVIESNFGAPHDALVIAVARLLGFATTSAPLRERLDAVLSAMLARGEVRVSNSLVVRGG